MRRIGRGGMAVVHLARQLDLERDVALKELAGLWATDPVATLRFLREARLAGSLNHPNIVTVHEYFEHRGVPYIAMEFLPRGSLRPLVGTLSDAQVVGVLDGILAGLSHAADHGIVHRDLKPENVMLTDAGGVKIADFGIATAYDELASANLTPLGEFVGAPAYVSPEQVIGDGATAASDLYSIGVIAFELFTGRTPFADVSAGATLVKKVNERPPGLSSVRPDLDKRLAQWVDRLLERDPARRGAIPVAAREALEDAAETAFGGSWRREAALAPGLPPRRRLRGGELAAADTHTLPRRELLALLTHPLHLVVGGSVTVAAVVLEPWLYGVAAAAYVALVVIGWVEARGKAASAPTSSLQTAEADPPPPSLSAAD